MLFFIRFLTLMVHMLYSRTTNYATNSYDKRLNIQNINYLFFTQHDLIYNSVYHGEIIKTANMNKMGVEK